ncbi:helix-turn-helix domain-containing protein [Streptomyces xiamenensis]|uniref:helix-turn-helix domain-containing protein n=1 Tax=Streptomyces xiamenensis TaxID=408015 RepID=UPI0036EF660C
MRAEDLPVSYVVTGNFPRAVLAQDAPLAAHYAQEIALRIAEAMELRGMVQTALSERSGVGQNTISRILRGLVYSDVATLAKLEAALRADIYPTGLYRRYTN